MRNWHRWGRSRTVVMSAMLAFLVAACGGGGSTPATPSSASCDLATQKAWLRDTMLNTYLWSGASPSPDPTPYTSLQAYFGELLYAGSGVVPADRWSYITDSASYTQFFGEGKTLAYGVAVNGLEQQLPLKVRYVEPLSPAAQQGVVRGEVILAINGRGAADVMASGDFSALSPAREGDVLTLQLDDGSGPRSVTLSATVHSLTPMPVSRVLTLPGGGKVGYLVLKDFITQAEAPLITALADMRAAGATELILDLRYNGGGRLSTAAVLASLIAGAVNNGKPFARLSYNAQLSARNTTYNLSATLLGFNRVVVLTGVRTCSASELLVNGLKPHIQVSTVGGATCGKPFGFNPTASCDNTYSAVNFEVFNGLGEGRYYDGIAANCAVEEDFSGALGDATERLTAGALSYLQSGQCPVVASLATPQDGRALIPQWRGGAVRRRVIEPGMPPGMWAD